ncbi:MAG: iron-containing alcohol dehydrogenase [Isosphaeraceae bacterium]|jgi:alcohol dehydrogenase class IV|nr:MAG: iron-containing alcohol dehydrogenase [Isosphaeraceae bacterium]
MQLPEGPVVFTFPTRVVFGDGVARQVGEELSRSGVARPLVVTDRGLVESGLFDRVFAGVRQAVLFDGVQSNPTEADCLAGLALFRARGCDGVIGFGGGSPIDAAKAIRLLATHPGELADYDVTRGGMGRITANLPPMLAIPTTAGTGSEVGRAALIQLPQTGRKSAILSPYLIPNVAICDPELTRDLSPSLTAGTGMDALSHATESYLSSTFHPPCDGIALEALRYIARGLESSVRDGRDAEARRAMMMGSLLGGMSLQKGLGIVHALSHALGAEGRVHHGTLNAILLPHALRYNRPAAESRMVDLGMQFGLGRSADSAGHLIVLYELLLNRLPLPKRLGEVDGLDAARIGQYAERATRDHCLRTNPRPASTAELEELLREAW